MDRFHVSSHARRPVKFRPPFFVRARKCGRIFLEKRADFS